jgi:hypothetical protein
VRFPLKSRSLFKIILVVLINRSANTVGPVSKIDGDPEPLMIIRNPLTSTVPAI